MQSGPVQVGGLADEDMGDDDMSSNVGEGGDWSSLSEGSGEGGRSGKLVAGIVMVSGIVDRFWRLE